MLSVLIPTYNYDITALVQSINDQALANNIEYEILAYEDGSNSPLNTINQSLNDIPNCTFKVFDKNIGRSAIRNLLGKSAKYDHLLFIDAGTHPRNNDFIKKYLCYLDNDVTVGGATCSAEPKNKDYKLRWLYAKKRESIVNERSINGACNFLIQKKIFTNILFDGSIKKYGCEDIVFFDDLKKKNIIVNRINNPVIHDAEDDTSTFIKKTEAAIENIVSLIETNKINTDNFRVSKVYFNLKKSGLHRIALILFKVFKNVLVMNLKSSYCSLFIYDFYRLGYFSLIKNKK